MTSRCLPNVSDADDTENNDKSVVTLSCEGDLNIRHETDNACGTFIGFCVVILKCFAFAFRLNTMIFDETNMNVLCVDENDTQMLIIHSDLSVGYNLEKKSIR